MEKKYTEDAKIFKALCDEKLLKIDRKSVV